MPINLDTYKSVVRLMNTYAADNRQSIGSGIIFSPSGLVLTNNHVIEDPDMASALGKITVESLKRIDQPASDSVPADVVVRNEVYDLAVIQIAGPPPTHFIDILNTPTVDESFIERRIRVLGYPPLGGTTITVTRGIVSGFDETGNLKTDAEVNTGNSGGAAFDDLETFLGIPSFIVPNSYGKLAFIITPDRIKAWFATFLESGVPNSPQQLGDVFVRSNIIFSGDNLDQSPRYPRILGKFAAVETLLSQHEYARAIPHIEFILNKRSRSALAYHYLGNALLGLGRYPDAVAHYRACLGYDPNHVAALGNLGVALSHLGRHTEALQIFEQIIDVSDNAAELWASYNNIGQIYLEWGRAEVSDLYFEKATQLRAAAEQERTFQYTPPHYNPNLKGRVKVGLLEAIVFTEIEMEDQGMDSKAEKPDASNMDSE